MKIVIKIPLIVHEQILIPGRYQVSVDTISEIVLLNDSSHSIELKPSIRSCKVVVKTPKVQMRKVKNENRSLLVIRMPPATEWVVSLQWAPDNT